MENVLFIKIKCISNKDRADFLLVKKNQCYLNKRQHFFFSGTKKSASQSRKTRKIEFKCFSIPLFTLSEALTDAVILSCYVCFTIFNRNRETSQWLLTRWWIFFSSAQPTLATSFSKICHINHIKWKKHNETQKKWRNNFHKEFKLTQEKRWLQLDVP